jgi:hypothetical protein
VNRDDEAAACYRVRRRLLATHEGRHVVVVGEELVSSHDTYEDALRDGYARFGLGPFWCFRVEDNSREAEFLKSYDDASAEYDSWDCRAVLSPHPRN